MKYLKPGAHVLELGMGNGQLSNLLSQSGLDVSAIEFSPNMAAVAQGNAPGVRIIIDEFLAHDFGEEKFDGVIAIAFTHLFPTDDAARVMDKIYDLLKPEGINMQATTVHDKTQDAVVEKSNFASKVARFRRHYTPVDFRKLFVDHHFKIVHEYFSPDGETSRQWLVIVSQKSND